MKTAVVRPPVSICVLALVLMLATNACQRAPETNANLNVNSASASNANVVSNTNVSTEPISVIAAREPDEYRATLVFTTQTQGGEKAIGIPTLSAEVARSGAERRVCFNLT